jgi:hypothetical protein
MAVAVTGYLKYAGADVNAVTLPSGSSTDGDDLGAWLRGSLMLRFRQTSGVAQDIKLKIEVSPDGTEWFFYRTVVSLALPDSTDDTRVIALGSNGQVGSDAYFQYIRVTNETGVDIILTARYNVLV